MKILFFNGKCEAFKSLAHALANELRMHSKNAGRFNLALSGGESAQRLFEVLNSPEFDNVDWRNVYFFWVDERCVVPTSDASNFKNADELFLKKKKIEQSHIFRIEGEECPVTAAQKYSKIVADNVPTVDGKPHFDCIILGAGADGHVASIFPMTMKLLEDADLYAVSCNTITGQWRVTMTGKTILGARKIFCPIVGESKRAMFVRMTEDIASGDYSTPAAYIFSHAKEARIFTDIKPE